MDRRTYWKNYYQINQEKIKRARRLRYKQEKKSHKKLVEQLAKWKTKLWCKQEAAKYWAIHPQEIKDIQEKIKELENLRNNPPKLNKMD